MSFRENIEALCKKIGVTYPPQDSQVKEMDITFKIGDEWKRFTSREIGPERRLFFQAHMGSLDAIFAEKFAPTYATAEGPLRSAEIFFSEEWTNAEVIDDSFLIAFKKSSLLRIWSPLMFAYYGEYR